MCVHTCIHGHMQMYVYTVCACMFVCIHGHVHVYVHLYQCVHMCSYVYMCLSACIHVHVHVCGVGGVYTLHLHQPHIPSDISLTHP